MIEHVPSHAHSGEEQMVEPMNTPVDLASQPTSKYHCNDIGNNEICISIINSKLYLYKCLFFAYDSHVHPPSTPCLSIY